MAYQEPDEPVPTEPVSVSAFGSKVRNSIIWFKEQIDALLITKAALYRQGGSATDWSIPGTTDYTPAKSIIQCGTFNIPKYSSIIGRGTVTFPTSFSQPPVILISNVEYAGLTIVADLITATNFRATYNGSDLSLGADIAWIAIGPIA